MKVAHPIGQHPASVIWAPGELEQGNLKGFQQVLPIGSNIANSSSMQDFFIFVLRVHGCSQLTLGYFDTDAENSKYT